MAIQRIESVTYGVEDLPACVRFFENVGLEPIASATGGACFRTPTGQHVYLRPHDDPALPAATSPGSTIRELCWGVDNRAALDALARDLGADRNVSVDADGVVHSFDESGFGFALALARPVPVAVSPRTTNLMEQVGRRNAGAMTYGRARPLRLIHVALDILKEGRERAVGFYLERLGFRAIDQVLPMGCFMQCEGDIEHHNFLLCHRPDRIAMNHLAMEVRDADEVIEGGNYMHAQGWKESRRLGRHNLGSNIFRMFHAPCGGRIEYAADMDRMDRSFKPRVWAQTPPHNLWMVKFPGDTDTA